VVLVVGAGSTGLLLASDLSRRGVPCHVIDAEPAPLHWDRATVVHPRSLQIFESLGRVEKFLIAGCRQRVVRIHSGGDMPQPGPSSLHALGHRAGSTLILVGGPTANPSALSALHSALQEHIKHSTLFETAVALSAGANDPDSIGHLHPTMASQLGMEGSTLLAIRPDGFVGVRADRDHLAALQRYSTFLQTGHS
jgi:2-polyprenyl-6-methoxyphenol hydroxylase-like FAD-dependent oxidoreductase